MAKLTKYQKELMEHAIECDGAELPVEAWDDAQVLVEHGYATLSGRRGPGGSFRRLIPVTKPVYHSAGVPPTEFLCGLCKKDWSPDHVCPQGLEAIDG